MIPDEEVQEKQYGTKKIRYLGLIDYLSKNAALVEVHKNGDHEKSIYHYNSSTIVVKLEKDKLRLKVVSNTGDQSSIIFGDLEKILLNKK